MCSKKHPGLAVIDLHLLLGQLDVHPLSDELRRDAVAMRAVGSVESNAVSLVHGVDLPFAVLIGMSGQRLQTALLLFLKTSSSRNVSSLPGALIEFVHVFANHLLKLLSVFGQCMSFGLQMELSAREHESGTVFLAKWNDRRSSWNGLWPMNSRKTERLSRQSGTFLSQTGTPP